MKVTKTKNYNLVSVDEAKQHLRIPIEDTSNDVYIQTLIKVATRIAEEYIGDDVVETTTTLEDYDINDSCYVIYSPNVEVVSISGDTAITGYTVHNFYNYSRVYFGNFINVKTLVIKYKSGYNNEDNFDIKHAILLKIGELFDVDRNNYVTSNMKETRAFEYLLNPYRILI